MTGMSTKETAGTDGRGLGGRRRDRERERERETEDCWPDRVAIV